MHDNAKLKKLHKNKLFTESSLGYCFLLISVFMWIGFVCAISFMEAWIKFKAPGVTLQIGLGIGKLVFAALNKVEWVLGIIALFATFSNCYNLKSKFSKTVFLQVAIIILSIQTFYLLPILDQRAMQIIQGHSVTTSNNHLFFIILEMLKVCSLFIFGFKSLYDLTQVKKY